MDTSELSEDFVDAGWAEWDLDDALLRIQDAIDYMDTLGSL